MKAACRSMFAWPEAADRGQPRSAVLPVQASGMRRSRLRVPRGTALRMETGVPSASGCTVSCTVCHVEPPSCSTALGQKLLYRALGGHSHIEQGLSA